MLEKSTSDPLVAMKAECDRLRAGGDRLLDADHEEQVAAVRLAIWDRIERTPAVSFAGLIAQLEMLRGWDDEPGCLDVLIAGVCNIEASMPRAPGGGTEPEVIGFGER